MSPSALADSRTWQTATFNWQVLGGTLDNGDEFATNVIRLMDASPSRFDVFRDVGIASGRYWWTRGQLSYATSPGRPMSVTTTVGWGGFYDGRSADVTLSGTWRGGGHVIVGADLSRTEADLPEGHFVATQTAGRVEYAFSTRSDFLGFLQFNNEERRTDFDLRYHWIPALGDDLFVVWNSGYTTESTARDRFPSVHSLTRPLNGALIFKLVHRM